jgi:hypothetical protein
MKIFRPAAPSQSIFGDEPTRREFLLGGVRISLAFFASEALAGSARAGEHSTARRGCGPLRESRLTSIPHLHESLNVLAAYLVRYSPPTGDFPNNGGWTANYDLIEWEGSSRNANFVRRNCVIGRMTVGRLPGWADGAVDYELDYAIGIRGFESTLKSTMQCSAGPLPGLQKWKTRYESRAMRRGGSGLALSEDGRHQDGMMEIVSAAGVRRFKTDRPVVTQWGLMDRLRGARTDGTDPMPELEFDLLHDLTSYRPNQRLAPCGVLEIGLDDRRQTLHGFAQIGTGTAPTHYWVDTAGRTLLVTGGLLSMGLNSVEG